MPSTLTPTAGTSRGSADPARSRGLRRKRTAAPCPPIAVVEIPRKPTAAEILVLVSRARQARVDAGELDQSRLFDVRVFKCVAAELAYYRRLAFAQTPSAHIATSMPQLVKGLARLHPRWDMSGDAFDVRDRHQSAVRRRLRVMADCGLLTWQAGTNLEGEECRTELLLLAPPAVTPDELKAARAQLARWRDQYGTGLNTGSTTGIRNVTKAAAALTKAQCQMRARNRVQQLRAARIRVESSQAKTAPPFGTALAFGQERNGSVDCVDGDRNPYLAGHFDREPEHTGSYEISSYAETATDACGVTTGARASARVTHSEVGAVEGPVNCIIEGEVGPLTGSQGAAEAPVSPYEGLSPEQAGELAERRVAAALLDVERMQRLAEEEARRAATAEAIAATARRLMGELAESPAERSWPHGRVREAWFVARYGASMVPGGPDAYRGVDHAGPKLENDEHALFLFRLDHNRLAQLHRAVRRYEAHADERPQGWPARGWAAFLYAAALWQHKWPAGTVEGLHVLATRMRAHGQADDPDRLEKARRGAEQRRHAPQAGPINFRPLPDAGGRWPAWFVLEDGQPTFEPGHFADGGPAYVTVRKGGREIRVQLGRESVWVDERVRVDRAHAFLPPASDPMRRLAERDAFLLAGKPLPPSLDGRRQMRDRDTGAEPPSGYQRLPALEADVLELVRLDPRHSVEQALRFAPELRAELLAEARAASSRRLAVERGQLMDRLGRGTQS